MACNPVDSPIDRRRTSGRDGARTLARRVLRTTRVDGGTTFFAGLACLTDFFVGGAAAASDTVAVPVTPTAARAKTRERSKRAQRNKEHPANQLIELWRLIEMSIHINHLQGIPQAFTIVRHKFRPCARHTTATNARLQLAVRRESGPSALCGHPLRRAVQLVQGGQVGLGGGHNDVRV